MHSVSLDEAKQNLTKLVEEVEAGGEVLILRDNVPAAKLIPAIRPGYGSWRGQARMAEDFDSPLDDFVEYMP